MKFYNNFFLLFLSPKVGIYIMIPAVMRKILQVGDPLEVGSKGMFPCEEPCTHDMLKK
jgi:hypothetical protein